MTTASVDEVFNREITDPLSEVTRIDRRWLLIANVVLAAMAYGGIVPTEINALGLKASQLNRSVIFDIAWVTALYLTVSFALYVSTDHKAWKTRMGAARQCFIEAMLDIDAVVTEDEGDVSDAKVRELSDLFDARMRPFERRAKFEIYFPLLLSALNLPAAALF